MFYFLPWSLATIIYLPIFFQLYSFRWQMLDYTHAYFILPVSLWLVWKKRKELTPIFDSSPRLTIFSLCLLVFGLLIFVFGWRQDYLFISAFSMVPVSFGLVLYLYGQRAAKALLFPILYLLLLIPPPFGILDSITLPMRYGVSIGTEIILKLFDIPLVRDGLLLSLNGNEIYMGAPCSGMRSLVTMFALGLAYVYLIRLNNKHKTFLVLAIIPFALAGNLIRTVITCLCVFYIGPQMAEGPVHFLTGLAVFILMLGCFIALEKKLERSEDDQ